jgi:DNA polymerase-3 subunit gamma/tau
MKKEIERAQSGLLDYLKEKLNNYSIQLKISVSEEVAKQYAFTPEEKYEKLKSKNPSIELLRSKFDLDLS